MAEFKQTPEAAEFVLGVIQEERTLLDSARRVGGLVDRPLEDIRGEEGYYEGVIDSLGFVLGYIKGSHIQNYIRQLMERDRRISPVLRFNRPFNSPFRQEISEGGENNG